MSITKTTVAKAATLASAALLAVSAGTANTASAQSTQLNASKATSLPADGATAYASGPTAPACIKRTVYVNPDYTQVFLYNTCGKKMHVNIVVKHGGDMGCKAIKNKHQLYHVINWGTYKKTVLC